ncbi:MAG: iron chelate uptake ABC transporter family permease subunit [Desulfobacterales bacterium]|nr:iron chelate uptake ABC transporter family permease subunit [Desulfobacterales bacterium]
MGDLSLAAMGQVGGLALVLAPCFLAVFLLSHPLNLLTMGTETAQALGIRTQTIMVLLLVITSLMIGATVAHCGLVGFVGLVMPHLLRLILGPDHRVLVPACIWRRRRLHGGVRF